MMVEQILIDAIGARRVPRQISAAVRRHEVKLAGGGSRMLEAFQEYQLKASQI